MNRTIVIIFIVLFFCSCGNKTPTQKATTLNGARDSVSDNHNIYNTIATPFTDRSYQLKLHVFDRGAPADQKNAVLTFSHAKGSNVQLIFRDSLYCFHTFPYISLQDMNNDGQEDVLISCSSGARANLTYHLYLVDTINHTLTHVQGFEDIINPEIDPSIHIITSVALSGSNYFSFYKINSKKQLINLGHDFEVKERAESGFAKQYKTAISQILKENKD